MNGFRRRLVGIAMTSVALASAVPTAAGAAPTGTLIEATPAAIQLDVPAPGQTYTWDMAVRSVSDSPVILSVATTGESEKLFSGPTPLVITLKDKDGDTVVGPMAAGELIGSSQSLPDLGPRQSYQLTGHATLPRDAGNEYQNAGGRLTLRFTATDAASTTDGAVTPPGGRSGSILASTGSTVVLGFVLIATTLTGAGLLLITKRKRGAR